METSWFSSLEERVTKAETSKNVQGVTYQPLVFSHSWVTSIPTFPPRSQQTGAEA